MPPRPNCTVCASIFVTQINGLLAQGWPTTKVVNEMVQNGGFKVSYATMRDHRRVCMGTSVVVDNNHSSTKGESPDLGTDFAVAVQKKALEQLSGGKLRVTARDGLNAQALIDRREERSEDRKFMLGLARLLSGGGGAAPAEVIDGEYVEVLALNAVNPLLAPAELRLNPAEELFDPAEITQ